MQIQDSILPKESILFGEERLYKLEGRGWFSKPPYAGMRDTEGYIGGVYDYSDCAPEYCHGRKLPNGSILIHLKGDSSKGQHDYVPSTSVLMTNLEDVSELKLNAGVEDVKQLKDKRVRMYLEGETSRNVRVIGLDLMLK